MKLLKTKLSKVIITAIVAVVATVVIAVPFVEASQPRDFDNNAVVYGGYYSVNELNNKLNHGTGKPYQSSSQLKNLYNTLGIEQGDFDQLKNGTVYKDGRVMVDGKVIFRDAHSMGRQYMSGSTRDNRFPYPVYWRSTNVSFASGSLSAYVKVNYDGTMAYALLKACGNPVKGVGKKQQPKYNLTIKKYEDLNGNKTKQGSEPFLGGWTFKVSGNGINKKVTTDKNGQVTLKDLKNGAYKVSEIQKDGWTSTTGLDREIKISGKDAVILFGNKKKVIPKSVKFNIEAVKYEDVNGNAVLDNEEALLSDWSIKLTGNGINQEYLTNGEGLVTFRDLPAGTYQVSELNKSGWRNITPLTQTVTVNVSNPLGYVEFGNQKVPTEEVVVTTTSPTLPVSGPAEMIIGSFATLGLGSAGYIYRKSRKRFSDSLKQF
jgi:hypothetical protein